MYYRIPAHHFSRDSLLVPKLLRAVRKRMSGLVMSYQNAVVDIEGSPACIDNFLLPSIRIVKHWLYWSVMKTVACGYTIPKPTDNTHRALNALYEEPP